MRHPVETPRFEIFHVLFVIGAVLTLPALMFPLPAIVAFLIIWFKAIGPIFIILAFLSVIVQGVKDWWDRKFKF